MSSGAADAVSLGPRGPTVSVRSVRATTDRAYELHFVESLLHADLRALVPELGRRRALLVSTPTVASHFGHTILQRLQQITPEIGFLELSCNEAAKSMAQVMRVCEAAQECGLGRESLVIAVGGGVCLDVVTLAASIIRRGIGHVRIPTTLTGQVDAGVGIKGAVNHRAKKSWLGCFHPPEQVLIDPALLRTLPTRHLRCGVAEIIKMSIIADAALFEWVEGQGALLVATRFQAEEAAPRSVVQRAALRMVEHLEPNLHEDQTYRRAVDFGHTFSPVLESTTRYDLAHGEAVSVDMAVSCCLAKELGLLDHPTCERILNTLRAVGLPVHHPSLTENLFAEAVAEACSHRGGQVNLVVPKGLGDVRFVTDPDDIPSAAIRAALNHLTRRAGPRAPARHTGSAALSRTILVFDVGGTHTRAAKYDVGTNELRRVLTRSTPSHWTQPPGSDHSVICRKLFEVLAALADEVLAGAAPASVAVAFAGPIDPKGCVLGAPTIWGSLQQGPVDLQSKLQRLWPSAELRLLNDVTAAGYRYLRDVDDSFCIVTVGSGIGNKVFLDGRPCTGSFGRGGEIGHIRVDLDPEAPLCDCGGQGHLGAVASGRGALQLARRWAREDPPAFRASLAARLNGADANALSNEDIVAAFHHGDPWCCQLIQRIARPLGQVLAGLHLAVGLERFVIYGGFALALGDRYRQELVSAACAHSWDRGQDWDAMVELGFADDDSGMIGAGRYAAMRAG